MARIVDEYHTMTLPVIRAIEGKGRNIGMLGSLDLDDHGSEVHVYLGFTDEERQRLWKKREALKTGFYSCKFQYKEIFTDSKGNRRIDHPVFISLIG